MAAGRAGAYAITGQAAVLNPMLAAVAGSYVITGQGAVFAGRMPVTAGAYALTGQAATFRPIETVASGAYAIAGSPVIYNVTMACAAGAYALTGSLVAFTQVINGAGGYPNLYRGKLQLERRKIRITDDEGRSRKVDMLRHLKPPPPFAPAPDWVLDKAKAAPVRRPEPPAPMLPTVLPAPRLPESLTALQDARDENELVEFLTNTPDPLVEDIRQVLGVLASTGQLDRLLENA
jgi:hypothetical protein